jgi:hypothetical protein
MESLTQPLNGQTATAPAVHVDEWLDDVSFPSDPGEVYARWWLDQARYPAWKKSLYAPLMRDFRLFCTYKGDRFRCTGASRLGDVWLAADHARTSGYDLRVNVTDCSQWGREP